MTAKKRARYRLDFVEHLYLFSDWPSTAHDVVLAPGETAAILYRAARQLGHSGTSLDLGCGSGVLALLLAAQSDRVIATDLNPRAIELTELNAQLNGIVNVECRQGSLFDPVVDEGVAAIGADDEARTDGIPQRLVHRLLANAEDRGERRRLGRIPEAGHLLQCSLRFGREARQLPGQEIPYVVGVILGVNASEVPGPSRRLESQETLASEQVQKLDYKERITSSLRVH